MYLIHPDQAGLKFLKVAICDTGMVLTAFSDLKCKMFAMNTAVIVKAIIVIMFPLIGVSINLR